MTVPAESSEKLTCGGCLLLALLWPLALILSIMAFGQEEPKQRWAKRIRFMLSLAPIILFVGLMDMLVYIFTAHRQLPLGYVFQGIIAYNFTFFGFLIERFAQVTRNSQVSPPMLSSTQRFLGVQGLVFWSGLLLWVLLGAQLGFPTYADPLKLAFCGLAGLWLFVIPLINTAFSLLRRQRARR